MSSSSEPSCRPVLKLRSFLSSAPDVAKCNRQDILFRDFLTKLPEMVDALKMELAVSFETSAYVLCRVYAAGHTHNQCTRAVTCAQLLVRHLVAPPAPPPHTSACRVPDRGPNDARYSPRSLPTADANLRSTVWRERAAGSCLQRA